MLGCGSLPRLVLARVSWDQLTSPHPAQAVHRALAQLRSVLATGPGASQPSSRYSTAGVSMNKPRSFKASTTSDSYSAVNKAANADANINSHDPVVPH